MGRIRSDVGLRVKLAENPMLSAEQFSHENRINYLLNLVEN
jgi:hypothetical protein